MLQEKFQQPPRDSQADTRHTRSHLPCPLFRLWKLVAQAGSSSLPPQGSLHVREVELTVFRWINPHSRVWRPLLPRHQLSQANAAIQSPDGNVLRAIDGHVLLPMPRLMQSQLSSSSSSISRLLPRQSNSGCSLLTSFNTFRRLPHISRALLSRSFRAAVHPSSSPAGTFPLH